MDTATLKKFAQTARRSLMDQVSNKMKVVLALDSLARRESAAAVAHLESLIREQSQEYVIERVAYIWFNRFSALRFMDVNHYTPIGIVSPADGQSQPEILAEAKAGHIDSEIVPSSTKQKVNDLLANRTPSANPQAEVYRLLLVAACNYWNQAMPFLFEKIADYTELLMPDDLLSDQSILAQLRLTMTLEDCGDVEIIGWLYQFYISEKKDEVFEGLKKNKKITPENIPAATQLFTPHWVVRYLVENSLGRLWMLNHPNSCLVNQMNYYIKPEVPEKDFLKINSPEEIKICDPACGSGHMLVYAFDLLYVIYEEEGYDIFDIPAKILTNNLYGIEIDERAGELAAFALTMKARSRQRLFFRQQVRPNVCVMENVKFELGELKEYLHFIGRDLFTLQLQNTLLQFEEADNFGSLIQPDLNNIENMISYLDSKKVGSDIFLNQTHNKVLKVLEQTEYLRSKYHVVVANPPYMGGSGMNERLSRWIKEFYPDSKADLFAAFIERNFNLVIRSGLVSMITMQSWMFLSSFEKIRNNVINRGTILSMAHLGARAFDSIGGEVVSTTAFIIKYQHEPNYNGAYFRLNDGESENAKANMIVRAIKDRSCGWFYLSSASKFKKIPGSPIAYWINNQSAEIFSSEKPLKNFVDARIGMVSGDNDRFLRLWSEVGLNSIEFNASPTYDPQIHKWYPLQKGGEYRLWYGNMNYVINWENDGYEIKNKNYLGSRIRSHNYNGSQQFKEGITWNSIASVKFACRYSPVGFTFDAAGPLCEVNSTDFLYYILGMLSSKVANYYFSLINPTMNFPSGYLESLPLKIVNKQEIDEIAKRCIMISKTDWNSSEISWDFLKNPFIQNVFYNISMSEVYQNLVSQWREIVKELKKLEERNNQFFIESYGLTCELSSEVPLSEISLNCNIYYRYGTDKSENELESLFLADTMRDLISYAVGCIFGRYSIDKPGLILANQGETITDYLDQIPSPTFMADEDNVIPILDGDWFSDDIVERFRLFLRITFGEEHFGENLKFVEDAIGKDIRSFFLKDFYSDHIKRYKKRPIYWLFSSPKGTFNALIYMHRYRSDTVSIVLNKYLREFKVKLSARMEYLNRIEVSANASKSEKTRAIKERETIKKNLEELDAWERDVLYPLALEQKEINLDDGVKVNYPKFGAALKKIPGLDAEED